MTDQAPDFISGEDTSVITDEVIGKVAALANQQAELEERIEEFEAHMKALKERHRQVCEVDLPNAMAELNAESFTTTDGLGITIKDELSASITKAKQPEAFSWLRENGHGGLIKTKMDMAFSKGSEDLLNKAKEVLDAAGMTYNCADSVHAGTLKAFCKEQIAAGHQLGEAIGVYQYKRAKLSRATK